MRHLVRTLLDLATRPADAGTDADLLARFAHGRDAAAFAALVDRHGPMVLGVARRVLRDPVAADDAFQATFLALARSAAAVRRPGGLPAWLHRTVVRAATRLARARRPAPLDRDPPAAAADPLDALTARELLAAVDDEVSRLPAPLRAAVVACGLEGRSQDEAARLLGWTPGQVRGRLERGRRRLEARLARRGLIPAASGIFLVSTPPAVSARLRDGAVALATGTAAPPPAVAAVAAAVGRTLPARSAVALAVGLVAAALAGLAPGREPRVSAVAPLPPAAETGEVPLPDGAVRRFGAARLRVGDGPLAVAPDGKSVVAVSPQGRVRVLDAGTGRVTSEYLLPLKAEAFYTGTGAILSADGSTAVTQLWNADATGNTLAAWDLAARRQVWNWTTVNGGTVETAALTADGKRLFVVEPSADWKQAKVKAVDLATSRERVVIDGTSQIGRLHLSPDGKRVVLARGDQPAACHDAETGAKLWETPRFGSVAAFSPDGAVLFTECRDPFSRVLALDSRTGESVAGLAFPDQVFEMSLAPTASPDGRTILIGDSKMRGFVIWDYRAGREVGVVPGYAYEGGYPRRSAVFSRDGKVLFTGLDRLGRWDAATGKALDPADPADGHASPVAGVRYSPDGREVYSLDTRWRYRRWAGDGRLRDAGEAKPEPTRNPDQRGGVTRAGDTTMVFDRFPVAMMMSEKAPDAGAQFARFPPLPLLTVPAADGRREVTLRDESVGEKRRLSISTQSGTFTAGVELPWTKSVPARPVSPCGRWVVVGGTVYSTATGRVVLAPEAPGVGGRPARLATDAMRFERVWFSPDGRFAAGTLEWQDDTPRGMRLVAAWELASGAAFPAVPVHSHHDAAVSPGGRTLVDGGIHGITAHDLIGGGATRLAPRDLTTGFDYRRSQPIGFHPAGRAFVTGHVDGSVIEWAVPHAARAAAAPNADTAWADLASPDLRVARAAVEQLVDHPAAADVLLKARFAPPVGGPRDAAKEGPVSGDLLRGVRAIEVLERTGTPAARVLLAGWRNQPRHPRLAAEAEFALDRLDQAGPPG